MPVSALSAIWYPISKWVEAKRFYVEILGLTLEACSDEAGWAALRTPGSTIPLFLVRKTFGAGLTGGAVVTFGVTELNDLLARIADFGCHIDSKVQEGSEVRIYTVFDPDGNALELSEAVSVDTPT